MSDEVEKQINNIVAASHDSGSHVVHDIFAAFAALSRLSAEVHKVKVERRRQRRNERARARYALNKKLGRPQRKVKEPEEEYDYGEPESCYCHMGYPPCGWCTREVDEDDDA